MHSAVFKDLRGKSVFITGGASGIGAALVEGFVAQGANVAFIDLQDGAALCERLGSAYAARPLSIVGDITNTEALRAAIAKAADKHGPIDILVNNAAHDDRHDTLDVTPEYWRGRLAVNLDHQFFAAQAVIPGMVAKGGGAIINFTSVSYMMGLGGFPAYTAAKAAIVALTRGLAREWGPNGIRVNAVAPGWVMTERQLKLWATPEAQAGMMMQQCLKRHLDPADMVGPVLFLASDTSAMMTSQVVIVDGGVVVSQ